jgi:hypothetical protein
MNSRQFLKNSLGAAVVTSQNIPPAPKPITNRVPYSRSRTKIAAYYLAAYIYTSLPRHITEDMAWMADKGANYVCVSILEQDLFAAYQNQEAIIEEAGRAGMQVLAVPSRWSGLTAGLPKVPSLFSVLNTQTWIVNEHGSTRLMTKATGAISSVHAPETYKVLLRYTGRNVSPASEDARFHP